MAVKLPPNTWKAKVINPGFPGMPSGMVDVVYSRINGEQVGYIKDGKFVQTVDKLPEKPAKKVTRVSPEVVESTTPQAIVPLEQDAEYYKNRAQNPNLSAEERAKAKAEYDALQIEIEKLKQRGTKAGKEVKEKKQAAETKSLVQQADELKNQYEDLLRKKNVLLDPNGEEAQDIQTQMNEIENEYQDIQTKITKKPVTAEEARRVLSGQLPLEGQTSSIRVAERTTGTQKQDTGEAAPTSTTSTTATPTKKSTAKGPARPSKVSTTAPETKAKRETAARDILAEAEFQIIDAVADTNPEIRAILELRVNGEITDDEMRRRLRASRFIAANGPTIRQRIVEKAAYDKLSPEERATGNSLFATEINRVTEDIKSKAKERGATITDADAAMIAEKLYMTGQDNLDTVVIRSIIPYIKVGMGPEGVTVGGAARANYEALVRTAYNNGVSEKELPAVLGYNTIDEVLQNIAGGESVGTFQGRIRNYAMTGQSDFVKNQLGQGVDLRVVASPYITAMATMLELNPQDIKLNDPSLMMALKDNGMNIYDYKKALKKDKRWQYTENAADDVASKTLRILRDFGLEA